MKIWRLTLIGKLSGQKTNIYHKAETEKKAREYYDEVFNRFHYLVKITDITNTKKGKKLAESL